MYTAHFQSWLRRRKKRNEWLDGPAQLELNSSMGWRVTILLLLFFLGCGSNQDIQDPVEEFQYGDAYYAGRHACKVYTPFIKELSYGPEYTPIVEGAVEAWNNALGEDRFNLLLSPTNEENPFRDPELKDGAIFIHRDDTLGRVLGFTLFLKQYGVCACQIAINPIAQSTVNVLIHELGHCLGLGHVPDIGSIMYPAPYANQVITQEMIDLVKSHTE